MAFKKIIPTKLGSELHPLKIKPNQPGAPFFVAHGVFVPLEIQCFFFVRPWAHPWFKARTAPESATWKWLRFIFQRKGWTVKIFNIKKAPTVNFVGCILSHTIHVWYIYLHLP